MKFNDERSFIIEPLLPTVKHSKRKVVNYTEIGLK